MKRKVIGILGRPGSDSENDSIIALYKNFNSAIIRKDCIPFMITPVLDIDYENTPTKDIGELTLEEMAYYRDIVDMCDGIIMPGGYRWYNFDEYVLKYAISKDIPVLGICLGMQLLASIDNGEYSLEENKDNEKHVQRNVEYAHDINIVKGSKLYEIIKKDTIKVNSRHKYHVAKVNNYNVSAYSSDGVIEAIEDPSKKFVMGVQWHLEKMTLYDIDANTIFDKFIEAME